MPSCSSCSGIEGSKSGLCTSCEPDGRAALGALRWGLTQTDSSFLGRRGFLAASAARQPLLAHELKGNRVAEALLRMTDFDLRAALQPPWLLRGGGGLPWPQPDPPLPPLPPPPGTEAPAETPAQRRKRQEEFARLEIERKRVQYVGFGVEGSTGPFSRPKRLPPAGLGFKCCPDEFLYPIPDKSRFAVAPSAQGSMPQYGYKFEVLATFKPPTPDDMNCACECCMFFQYVESYVTSGGRTIVETPLPTQDCYWVWESEVEENKRAQEQGGVKKPLPLRNVISEPPPKTDAQGHALRDGKVDRVIIGCLGDSVATALGATSRYIESQCGYWLCDFPGFTPQIAVPTNFRANFLGEIVDVCNGWRVLLRDNIDVSIAWDGFAASAGHGPGFRVAGPPHHTTLPGTWPSTTPCSQSTPPAGFGSAQR
jgi:hypothetical protein